jgi:hypothetical protein
VVRASRREQMQVSTQFEELFLGYMVITELAIYMAVLAYIFQTYKKEEKQ